MEYIKLIPQVGGENMSGDVIETAAYFDNCGADELYYYDANSFQDGQEEDVKIIKAICRATDIPLNVFAKVKRFEDVKKMIYAGAKRVIIRTDAGDNLEAVKEASERFGADRIYLYLPVTTLEEDLIRARKAVEEEGFGGIVLGGDFADNLYVQTADFLKVKVKVPVLVMAQTSDEAVIADVLKMTMADGVILSTEKQTDMMDIKQYLKKEKLPVNSFESSISFD